MRHGRPEWVVGGRVDWLDAHSISEKNGWAVNVRAEARTLLPQSGMNPRPTAKP